jgi:hypothetical protein
MGTKTIPTMSKTITFAGHYRLKVGAAPVTTYGGTIDLTVRWTLSFSTLPIATTFQAIIGAARVGFISGTLAISTDGRRRHIAICIAIHVRVAVSILFAREGRGYQGNDHNQKEPLVHLFSLSIQRDIPFGGFLVPRKSGRG